MNYFINDKQQQELAVMAVLKSKKYEVNGKEKLGKMLLMGLNHITLSKVYLKEAINGRYYITCAFTRGKESVIELIHPIEFAPYMEFVFDYDKASEICTAFGHELLPQPDGYAFNDYIKGVARRLRTFEGNNCYAIVEYTREKRTDEYGRIEKRRTGFNSFDDIEDYREKVSFYKDKPRVDWNMLCSTFKKK